MRLCSAMPSVVAAKPVKPVIISGFVESSTVLVLTFMDSRYNNSLTAMLPET